MRSAGLSGQTWNEVFGSGELPQGHADQRPAANLAKLQSDRSQPITAQATDWSNAQIASD